MKNFILSMCFLSLCCLSNATRGQALISDFTNWTIDTAGYDAPYGWTTVSYLYHQNCVVQGVDRMNGPGYSLMLTTLMDTTGVFAISPEANLSASFTGIMNPTFFNGYWRFNCQGGNGTMISIILYDATHTVIGQANTGVRTSGFLNWTYFNLPINYTLNTPVTTYSIRVWMEHTPLPPIAQAATLNVDDLSFDFGTVINQPENFNTKLISLINSQYKILFNDQDLHSSNISVIDINGKLLIYKAVSSNPKEFELYLSSFGAGMYYCIVENNSAKKIYKLIVTE